MGILTDDHLVFADLHSPVTGERALPLISPAYDLGATEAELRETYLRRITGGSAGDTDQGADT